MKIDDDRQRLSGARLGRDMHQVGAAQRLVRDGESMFTWREYRRAGARGKVQHAREYRQEALHESRLGVFISRAQVFRTNPTSQRVTVPVSAGCETGA
jgi:hypothetical protein